MVFAYSATLDEAEQFLGGRGMFLKGEK